ncbi:MAG: YCF48-related protein [bacterium]|nr:YCF48-related protein [bacterium]
MRIVICLLLLSPFFSNAQWTKQTSNTLEVLNNIHFVDNEHGYAVGNNGAMVATVTGGEDWLAVNTGLNSGQLTGVFFTDKHTGWICGTNGLLKRTRDYGAHWTTYNTGISTYLSGIYFTSEKTGFVSGQNGIILKTNDSGNTWTKQVVSTKNFINMHFRDPMNGYTCGGNSTIFSTSNAGVTWDSMYSEPAGPALYGINFINDKIGYSVGEYGTILKTMDGGATWVKQKSGLTKSLYSVHFLDSLNGWVASNQLDSILKTTDGGKNWVASSLNYTNGYYCVYFPTKNIGFIAGKDGAIFKLDNSLDLKVHRKIIVGVETYPNPVAEYLNIKSTTEIIGYALYDVFGKRLESKDFNQGDFHLTLDLKDYINGNYILEINCEGVLKREIIVIYR